jgi:N-acetylmuramoyl-L-alanine amidase
VSRKLTKEISWLLVLFTLLTICPSIMADTLTIKTTRKLVVIDPGHGGSDPGITSPSRALEKQITLELARMTTDRLNDRYRFLLTRTGDTDLSQTDRAAFANQNKADLYLSIHLHTKKNRAFFFYFDTPGTEPAQNAIHWRTQNLTHQTKSRQGAALFAKTFQNLHKETRPSFGPAPAIPLEGLQMTAILTEPFTIFDIPGTSTERQDFLSPHANALARAIEACFKNQF